MSVTLLDLEKNTIDLTGGLPAFTCSSWLNIGWTVIYSGLQSAFVQETLYCITYSYRMEHINGALIMHKYD